MALNETSEKRATLRYEEVAQELRQQIRNEVLVPGDRLPPLRMLRQKHGVTQATIDRAYSVLESEGLIVRSQRSGIFVAPIEQRRANGVIGFCSITFFKSNATPYWTQLIGGVEAAALEAGTPVMLLNAEAEAGWQKVDGVLCNGFRGRIAANRIPVGMPVVSLFALPDYYGLEKERKRALQQTTLVTVDDYGGMRAATEHLITLGHRRIAFLNNSLTDTAAYPRRLAGYSDALLAAGIAPPDSWLRPLPFPTPQVYFMEAARDAMRRWLQSDWGGLGCTALMTQNDDAACGAIEALREAGLTVPGDISVVGFDGSQSAEYSNPPLTTVELPLEQLGRSAVETLMRLIENGGRAAEPVVLPTRLCVRGTTAAPG